MFCLQSNNASLDVGRTLQTYGVRTEKREQNEDRCQPSAAGGLGVGSEEQGNEEQCQLWP